MRFWCSTLETPWSWEFRAYPGIWAAMLLLAVPYVLAVRRRNANVGAAPDAKRKAALFFGGMFFVLLTVAAWTSAISLLEPVAAWMVESFGWSRLKSCLVGGGGAWLLGIGSALSFNHWAGFAPGGRNFFDWSEFLSTSVLLPLGGMLIAVFAGWRMRLASTMEEMGGGPSAMFRAWLGLILFVAPVGVLVVFLEGTGLRALLVDALGRLAASVFG